MRVAVAQIEPKLGEKERNLDVPRAARRGRRRRRRAARPSRVRDPGLHVRQRRGGAPVRRGDPGPTTEAFERECARLGHPRVTGLLERDGDTLYNAAILVGPDGLIGSYRKTHLPFLGVDRFVMPGDELKVFDTPLGRIGLIICYDLRFPEVTRTLALAGADIVALPTELPDGREACSAR